MRILTNELYASLARNQQISQRKITQSLEKLSSGKRINQSSDDAAGLAITTRMTSQIKGNDMAKKNIQDALSLIQTAEGGLSSIQEQLQRMRELTLRAKNGTNNSNDLASIQQEIEAIKASIEHTSSSTIFNGISLLNTDTGVEFNGKNSFASIKNMNYVGNQVSFSLWAKPYEYDTDPIINSFNTLISTNTGTSPLIFEDGRGATFRVPGVNTTFWYSGGNKLPPANQWVHVTGTYDGNKAIIYINGNAVANKVIGTGTVKFNELQLGRNYKINDIHNFSGLLDDVQVWDRALTASEIKEVMNGTMNDANGDRILSLNFNEGDGETVFDSSGNNLDGTLTNVVRKNRTNQQELWIHTGANSDEAQKIMTVDTSLKSLGLSGLQATDDYAIENIDAALETVSTQRSYFGSYQESLQERLDYLDGATVEQRASRSQLEDADMAEQMSALTKEKIISQSSLSMLVQSNSLSEMIMPLFTS